MSEITDIYAALEGRQKPPISADLVELHRQCVEHGAQRMAFLRGEKATAIYSRLHRAGLRVRKQTHQGEKT